MVSAVRRLLKQPLSLFVAVALTTAAAVCWTLESAAIARAQEDGIGLAAQAAPSLRSDVPIPRPALNPSAASRP